MVRAAMLGRGGGDQGYSLVAGLRPYMQKGGVGLYKALGLQGAGSGWGLDGPLMVL